MSNTGSGTARIWHHQPFALIDRIATNTHTTDELILFTEGYLRDASFTTVVLNQVFQYFGDKGTCLLTHLTRIHINDLQEQIHLSAEEYRLTRAPGGAVLDQEQIYNAIVNGTATTQQKASFHYAFLSDTVSLRRICNLWVLYDMILDQAEQDKAMRLHRELEQHLGIRSLMEIKAIGTMSDDEIGRRHPSVRSTSGTGTAPPTPQSRSAQADAALSSQMATLSMEPALTGFFSASTPSVAQPPGRRAGQPGFASPPPAAAPPRSAAVSAGFLLAQRPGRRAGQPGVASPPPATVSSRTSAVSDVRGSRRAAASARIPPPPPPPPINRARTGAPPPQASAASASASPRRGGAVVPSGDSRGATGRESPRQDRGRERET